MRRLIALGCSFTQGVGLTVDSTHETLEPNPLAWPALTAEKLGWEVLNLAHGGSSIKYQAYQVLHMIPEFKPGDVVAVMWPNEHRTLILPGHGWQYPQDMLHIHPASEEIYANQYYKRFHSPQEAEFSSIVYMQLVKTILEKQNVPLINLKVDQAVPESSYENFGFLSKYHELVQINWIDYLVPLHQGEILKACDNQHYHPCYHEELAERLAVFHFVNLGLT